MPEGSRLVTQLRLTDPANKIKMIDVVTFINVLEGVTRQERIYMTKPKYDRPMLFDLELPTAKGDCATGSVPGGPNYSCRQGASADSGCVSGASAELFGCSGGSSPKIGCTGGNTNANTGCSGGGQHCGANHCYGGGKPHTPCSVGA